MWHSQVYIYFQWPDSNPNQSTTSSALRQNVFETLQVWKLPFWAKFWRQKFRNFSPPPCHCLLISRAYIFESFHVTRQWLHLIKVKSSGGDAVVDDDSVVRDDILRNDVTVAFIAFSVPKIGYLLKALLTYFLTKVVPIFVRLLYENVTFS